MTDKNKKYGLGVAALVLVLGLVAVIVSTSSPSMESDELLGSPDDPLTVDEIGPPPALIVDPEVSLSGALTPDGNFYQFERNEDLPDEDDLNATASRERWTALVFDDEYDSIEEFLNQNTTVTDQLTLSVIWDSREQDWDVYPNEIFRSDFDIDTLDIFDDEFEGTLIFNTSRAYEYIDHTEDRSGDFDAVRGWNYGPKPDFDSLEGRAVVVWEGDVTGNASRLTPSRDLNDPIDRDFYNDLDDDEVYWFYVKGNVSDSCGDNEAFVCGVDGNTYQNSCKADAEDVDVDYDGQCKTDRTALIGELEDDTLDADETLVLEFFQSSSDNSPETLDIEDSEVDLDDNDTDLAIFRRDGSRFEFVTAFTSSDVTVNNRSIEIDLDNNLNPGDYQLRIFDTFERERVREVELDFEVEAVDPAEGPDLVLAEDLIKPNDTITFETGVNNTDIERAGTADLDDIFVVSRCTSTTGCSSKEDITDEVQIRFASDDESILITRNGGFEVGEYEIEIKEGLKYDDDRLIPAEEYDLEVEAEDPVDGPALVLLEDTIKSNQSMNFGTGESNTDIERAGTADLDDIFVVSRCTSTTGCTTKEDITDEVEIRFTGDEEGIFITRNGGFVVAEYEIEIKEGLKYDDDRLVPEQVYSVEVEAGDALVLSPDDVDAEPGDTIDLESPNGLSFDLSDIDADLIGVVRVFRCDNSSCSSRTDITSEISFNRPANDTSVQLSRTGGFEPGKYQIDVQGNELVYSNGEVVEGGTYEFEVTASQNQVVFTYVADPGFSDNQTYILSPSVNPSLLGNVELADIEAAFNIQDTPGTILTDKTDCTLSLDNNKRLVISCLTDFGSPLQIDWTEVNNVSDNYLLEAGSLTISFIPR